MNIFGIWRENKKMLWEITGWTNGKQLTSLYIEAKSFDEALSIARERNAEYSCGRVIANDFRGNKNG